MPRLKALPRIGSKKSVPVKLSSGLAFRLQAFCEAHFNAAQNQVICRAVEELISRELERDEVARERFEVAMERLTAAATGDQEGLRVVAHMRKRVNGDGP
jgi:hypothetical protein